MLARQPSRAPHYCFMIAYVVVGAATAVLIIVIVIVDVTRYVCQCGCYCRRIVCAFVPEDLFVVGIIMSMIAGLPLLCLRS